MRLFALLMPRLSYILLLLCFSFISVEAQNPFTCEGQVWIIQQDSDALLQMEVGSNNGISTSVINNNLGTQIFALGFRTTDQMLYGINPVNTELYRIDADGNIETITQLNVDSALDYLAGEVTPDGNQFIVIGSEAGVDQKLVSINLVSGNYEVEELELDTELATVDIGFHPINFTMYGFDAISRSFYTQALNSPNAIVFNPIFNEHNISGFYFDAFGNMYGLGTALFGTISGLFNIDQSTGATSLIASSSILPIADISGCPFSLEFNNEINPMSVFPCSDLSFEYEIANQTGSSINNLTLEHQLPNGYSFVTPTTLPFGGTLDNSTPLNLLRIENINIPSGIHNYSVQAYVDDIAAGAYKSQAILKDVQEDFGSFVVSDDPASYATEDSTRMNVNRFEEDSLSFSTFLCQGNSVTLDGSEYGSNLSWSTGETSQEIAITETGLFTLSAVSGCEELYVTYEIVAASCPFTVEVGHIIEPDTIFGCSETTFKYILENSSGEDRLDVILLDTLPPGFTFLEIINNPYPSLLSSDLAPNVFQLEQLHLHQGIDTIQVLVQSGDFPPGTTGNKAMIKGLPELIGPIRDSDNPQTQVYLDSTYITIMGVDGQSLQVDTFLCEGNEIFLDASEYGQSFLWEDGSIESQIMIDEPGEYLVEVVSGCDSALVTYLVEEGENLDVYFSNELLPINQSESINLNPTINNEGSLLNISWSDLSSNSLSCYDCPNPEASPISDQDYTVYVENEYCIDSATVEVIVDETRYIYIPNIFSPNSDGINDYFFFQSPYSGTILSFSVFDRWGNLLFETNSAELNNERSGWNGISAGARVEPGVYIWHASIQFIDGKKEDWAGDVTLVY